MATRFDKLRAHLELARLSNAPTVVTGVLVGAALAGAAGLGRPAWLIACAMVCLYAGGMALNDLWDREVDRRHKPHRPLPSGRISPTEAAGATLAYFGVGLGLLAMVSVRSVVCGVVLCAAIAAYDRWHGRAWSVVTMAACRALVYATAYLGFAALPSVGLVVACAMLASYVLGLTLLGRAETDASRLGRLPVVFVVAPVAWLSLSTLGTLGWAVVAGFGAWVALQLRRAFVARQVGPAIGGLVAGIALLDAAILVAHGRPGWALIAIGLFGLTRLFQRFVRGD